MQANVGAHNMRPQTVDKPSLFVTPHLMRGLIGINQPLLCGLGVTDGIAGRARNDELRVLCQQSVGA